MSYIQVEIGGKQRGLKFNKMSQLIIEQKIDVSNLMTGVYAVVYAGLKANCYVKGIEPDFTFEDVCDWTDSLEDEVIVKITEAFKETEMYKKGQSYLADIEAAKKGNSQTYEETREEELMFAFGKLGWSEFQYYTSSPEAFYFACKGYFSKLQDESLAIRNAATIIFKVMGGKEDIDKIWPLTGQEAKKIEQPTKEWWAKMKEAQNKVNKQILDGRR